MIDLAIVLAFVAYAVTSGFLNREQASKGLDEYFLAGKSLEGWQAGTSMAASQFAADTPLLVTGPSGALTGPCEEGPAVLMPVAIPLPRCAGPS